MKTSKAPCSLLALLIISNVIPCSAVTLIWDANPTAPGNQDGGGVWDTTTNTWWDGVANVPWVNATAGAAFGVGSGAAGTITLAVPISVPVNLEFNAPGSGNYTISGSAANPLSLTTSPSISANVDAALNVVLAGEAFTKLGAGQLSLRPPADNTYAGTTFVNVGTLALNSSTGGRVLIPGNLTINSGAIVTNTGASGPVADTATVTVNTGGTYTDGTDVIETLVLAGGTVVQVGTETLTAATIDARNGSVIQSAGATGKIDGNLTKTTTGTVTWTARGSAATTGGLTNTIVNAGTLILDYAQNSSKLNDGGSLTVNGGTLVQANGSHTETVGAITLTGGVITNAGGTARLSVPTGSYDVRNGAVYTVLSGAAGLTKTTADIVILAAVNNYSGGTVISAGTLQLGDGNVSGTVSGAITDNTTLILNPGSAAATVGGVISGPGELVKTGSGTAAITAVNTYQGNTTINNGVLSIDGDATLGDATGTLILAGGTLSSTANRSVGTAPVANPINLVGDSAIATTSASSTVDLNLSNDSIGGSAGTLTFRNDAASGTGVFVPRLSGSGFNFTRPIVIANGAFGTTRLDSYNTTGTTQTFSGVISGSGGYRRNASTAGSGGVTVFNANNTYTGPTDVNRGMLTLNGSLGSSTVTVGQNGTLSGNGTINGPVTVAGGGTLSAGASIGRLTINNSLTFQANSTNVVEVSRNGSVLTNDSVAGLSSVTFDGTLIVNNLGPSPLQVGDSFQLFNIAGSGNFTLFGTPGGGNEWSFNPATGALTVVATGSVVPPLNFTQTGSNLQFSWTNALFILQAQTNTLGTGLVNSSSAWFNYPGGSSSPVSVPMNVANGSVFFRLIKP
ncbi:MAG TPA: autotransporter-associated beta strand repeat-containing protein [Verrucomicrobiae bacterium]|nr:autotransporter-associated beta strand repeat-containing protein [Verrucomicrobiae bacterium]